MESTLESPDSVPILPYFTAISLDLPTDFSAEAASSYLIYISTAHKACMWWLGDFLLHEQACGKERYEKAIQEAGEVGYAPQTCLNAMSVCRKFPKPQRWGSLTFSHHAIVAVLDAPKAQKLLETASAESYSVSELRAAKITDWEKDPNYVAPVEKEKCPTCGRPLPS
jgi:hypothetical protein